MHTVDPQQYRTDTADQLDDSLDLVRRFVNAVVRDDVACCQWKGHWKRGRWLRGQGDIDLLVDRAGAAWFDTVASSLGFKRTLSGRAPHVPGVWSYYGLDTETGGFVHLHVHFQISLGDGLTMNYRLPVENDVLATRVTTALLPVPSPEWEFIIYVLRMALLGGQGRPAERSVPVNAEAPLTELDYLRSRASSASVQSILAQRLAWIGPSLFAECLSIVERPAPRVRRWAVRWRLRCVWAANVRRAPYLDSFKQLAVRTTRRLQAWRYGPSAGKRLVDGGAIIALIGGDGSGKSTAVTGLYDWLSARFEVRRAHLGKPTPSLTRLAVAAVRRLTEACVRLTHRKLDTACADSADDPGSPTPHGLLEMLRSVVIARDRWRTYVRIRRFATAGGIVICDRYPLPYVRTMDSPNLHRVPTESLGPVMRHVARLLSRLEQRYYRQILEPDIIAVLRLDPEVAVARKTDEEPHYVRRRSEDLWSVDWTGTNAVVIDASRSKDDVLSELKALIWSRI